jgi:hypothetical protein
LEDNIRVYRERILLELESDNKSILEKLLSEITGSGSCFNFFNFLFLFFLMFFLEDLRVFEKYCGGINPKTHIQRAGVYWRLGYRERESTQGTNISGKKLDWMVRSKERREAYIHEVGHVDTSYVELEPPGGFSTTILGKNSFIIGSVTNRV